MRTPLHHRVRPGGWTDTIAFAAGFALAIGGYVMWDAHRWHRTLADRQVSASIAFGVFASLVGAGVYQLFQRRFVRKDMLYPRNSGPFGVCALGIAHATAFLGAMWVVAHVADGSIGIAGAAIFCALAWLMSRVQWTDNPPAE